MGLHKVGDFNVDGDVVGARRRDDVFVFEQKYEDQPEYHAGHYIINNGSTVHVFNLGRNAWRTPPRTVPAILEQSDRGKLDEILFAYDDKIYLLLYNRYAGLSLHSLWTFEDDEAKFELVTNLNFEIVAPGEDLTYASQLTLVNGPFEKGVYLIGRPRNSDTSLAIIRLELGGVISAQIVRTFEGQTDLPPLFNSVIVSALHLNDTILLTGAVHGCGLKWHTSEIVKYNILEQALETIKTSGEPYVLNLPRAHHYDPTTGRWYHFGTVSPVRSPMDNPNDIPADRKTIVYALENLDTVPTWSEIVLGGVGTGFNDIYLPSDETNDVVWLNSDLGVHLIDAEGI